MLESADAAFCAACGNGTCSEACHTTHYTDIGKCSFDENFLPTKKFKSIRSILIDNLKFAEEKQMPAGTALCKTTRSYLAGMKHSEIGYMYLQRGYRQYGILDVY